MPQVTLTNVYDSKGRRTSVADNLSTAGGVSFTYDSHDRMTNAAMKVGGTTTASVTFTYDAADRLTGLTRGTSAIGGDKTVTTFTYDNADRVTAITHTYIPMIGFPTTTLATYTYAYNAASELTSESHKDGTLTYTYDNTSQLTAVNGSNGTCGATGCDESFSYDTNGNRTMSGYTTGTGNRLTADGTYNYTYDDNGNTLTKTRITDNQKTEFTWDYRNRLTQVVVKDSSNNILQQSDYTYDAFNRRIIKSFDDDGPGPHTATVTKTIYDAVQAPTSEQIASGTTALQPDGSLEAPTFVANPYADFNSSNSLTMRYLYGPAVDLILARRDASGTVAWYLPDHLGTIRDIANTSGGVIDHISYSAYGKVTAESNSSNGDRFKFTSREYDSEIAQYHYRARFHDAATGRFLSNDPIGFDAGDTNIYRYVQNSPTSNPDPSGMHYPTPKPGETITEAIARHQREMRIQEEKRQKERTKCAIQAINGCLAVSMMMDRIETGGSIFRDPDGKMRYSPFHMGTKTGLQYTQQQTPTEPEGFYHIHPGGTTTPSGADIKTSDDYGVPVYYGTPNGAIYYYFDGETVTVWLPPGVIKSFVNALALLVGVPPLVVAASNLPPITGNDPGPAPVQ